MRQEEEGIRITWGHAEILTATNDYFGNKLRVNEGSQKLQLVIKDADELIRKIESNGEYLAHLAIERYIGPITFVYSLDKKRDKFLKMMTRLEDKRTIEIYYKTVKREFLHLNPSFLDDGEISLSKFDGFHTGVTVFEKVLVFALLTTALVSMTWFFGFRGMLD